MSSRRPFVAVSSRGTKALPRFECGIRELLRQGQVATRRRRCERADGSVDDLAELDHHLLFAAHASPPMAASSRSLALMASSRFPSTDRVSTTGATRFG